MAFEAHGPHRPRMAIALSLLGLAGLAGCPADDEPVPRALEIVVAGCAAWSPERACERLPDAPLRLWAPGRGPLEVWADGAPLTVTSTPVEAGQRISVDLPETTRRLEVRAGGAAAVLPITPVATATPTDPRRRAARALFDGGRSAVRVGRLDLGVERLTRSASVARAAGDEGTARDADLLASFIDVVLHGEVGRGAKRMQALARPPAIDGRGRVLDHYHRGLVAARTADPRRGLEELELAERWGRRIGSKHARSSTHERARLLMDLGRAKEAAAAFDGLLSAREPDEPCSWAAIAVSAGWARVVARPPFELDIAKQRFEQAEALYTGACPHPADANNARVNLAFVAALTDPAAARGHLARVEGPEQAESKAWRHALEGRLALDAGELATATRIFQALLAEAARISLAPLEWQARVGLGRVARRRRAYGVARAQLEAAEQVLARHGELVPINRGRRFLLEDRSESLQLLVATHLDAGHPADGLTAIRRARRRTARAVAARDALGLLTEPARLEWSAALARFRRARAKVRSLNQQAWTVSKAEARHLGSARARAEAEVQVALDALLHTVAPSRWFEDPRGALPEAPAGQLLVAPFAGAGAYHVFFARAGRVSEVRLDEAPDAATWSKLLPAHMKGVTGLGLLADPGGVGAGLRAATWRGAPLAVQLPIAYTLDLQPAPPRSPAPEGSVVVFDPLGDLADARREGDEVSAALARIAPPVLSLGPLEARPAPVRAALAGARIFHFAGHGEYLGPQGWQSRLRLAEGTLDMGDLLTLPTAPPWVVLTGCETARTRVGQASAGLGLAQVLLAAGSQVVVATAAPVDSALALTFSRALYRALEERPDLPTAFTAALASMQASGQPWRDFLLLTRSPRAPAP